MAKAVLDIAAELARLEGLAILELREEWRRLHQTPPPKRLSRDILLRGITYKLQEKAFGGLSKASTSQTSGLDCWWLIVGRKMPPARFVQAWHTARARMARADTYCCHPGRRCRVARQAL